VSQLTEPDAQLLTELVETYHSYHAEIEVKKRERRPKKSLSGSVMPPLSPENLWWRQAQREVEGSPPSPEEKRLTRTKAERLSLKRWRKASEDLPMHVLSEEVSYLEDERASQVMLELSGKGAV